MIETTRKQRRSILLGIALLAAISLLAWGGELDPPGPPAPTMKNLDTVEPRTPIRAADMPLTITTPGSYYFVEDLFVAGGITINTTCVTIDLNGFALFGDGASTGDGIVTAAGAENIEIKNGVVSGWSEDGIDLSSATSSKVSGVRVTRNGQDGVSMGTDSVLQNSVINANTRHGILLGGDRCLVRDNLVNSNMSMGIRVAGTSNQIRENSISANQSYGMFVDMAASDQIIVDNLFTGNGNLSLEMSEFSGGHIVARNIGRRDPANYNNLAGDWGDVSTAGAAVNPAGNINN